MDIEANDLLLFARVVDEGSFSRAAQRLSVPTSTLSRRITALETRLGERLLLRTTRKLTVTELGVAVLEHARHIAEGVEAAAALADHRQIQPSGRLRVSMPTDFAKLMLGSFLSEFVSTYPSIVLEVDFTMRHVDLIGENFDVAIRGGALADDATLAARRIAEVTLGLYASPAYLERRGLPATPDALLHHDALHGVTRNGEPMPWRLQRGASRWEGVGSPRAITNSPEVSMQMTLSGLGIMLMLERIGEEHAKKGELVRVLPEWQGGPLVVWAVFPGRRLMPLRTRVFIDGLIARFSPSLVATIPHSVQADRAVS